MSWFQQKKTFLISITSFEVSVETFLSVSDWSLDWILTSKQKSIKMFITSLPPSKTHTLNLSLLTSWNCHSKVLLHQIFTEQFQQILSNWNTICKLLYTDNKTFRQENEIDRCWVQGVLTKFFVFFFEITFPLLLKPQETKQFVISVDPIPVYESKTTRLQLNSLFQPIITFFWRSLFESEISFSSFFDWFLKWNSHTKNYWLMLCIEYLQWLWVRRIRKFATW